MAKIKVREILECKFAGLSWNQMKRTLHVSKDSVSAVCSAAERLGIRNLEQIPETSDDELYELFFPDKRDAQDVFEKPDMEKIHAELNRPGVTLKLLWEEYQERCREENLIAMSYATFTRSYSSFVGKRGFANHLTHKAGDRIEVDWSGPTMHFTDQESGKRIRVYLFVSDLVCSRLAYVEPTLSMDETAWLQCHINMWEYYGGVSRILVCDNLKTGVTRHPVEGEITLTKEYELLAEHYGTAIMPCHVRAPREKNSAENTVYNAALTIIAKLRDVEFSSFFALKHAVRRQLDAFNNTPFQKREGSRRTEFEENEREFLRPLPSAPFEIGRWVYGRKVQPNCHISFERNWYSVPFCYQGCTADVKATSSDVMIHIAGRVVKRHLRFLPGVRNQYRTDENDMPKDCRFMEWNADRIQHWADSIGDNCAEIVRRILSSRKIPEQTFNSALAILRMTGSYEKERIEKASAIALAKVSLPRYHHLKSILSANQDSVDDTLEQKQPKGRLKGAEYFKKFGGER